jgi:hypothetical protein
LTGCGTLVRCVPAAEQRQLDLDLELGRIAEAGERVAEAADERP